MTSFNHHPDGIVYIDAGAGRVAIPLAEFLLDEPDYPGLPEGIAGIVYEPGRRHAAFDAEGNARAGAIPETILDGYIAKAATYAANMAARHAPPPPTLEQRVRAVKAEAARRILAHYPDWKQRNLIMEGGAEYETMKTWIGAVRAASDAIEVRLATEPDLDIADDVLWPEG